MSTGEERAARRATWTAEVFRAGEHAEMEAADRRFWAAVPEDERATVAWQLSLELYSLAEPGSERRLPRSAFRVVRR